MNMRYHIRMCYGDTAPVGYRAIYKNTVPYYVTFVILVNGFVLYVQRHFGYVNGNIHSSPSCKADIVLTYR